MDKAEITGTLQYFWSGNYWYVTAVDPQTKDRMKYDRSCKKYPIGSGETKDEALQEFEREA